MIRRIDTRPRLLIEPPAPCGAALAASPPAQLRGLTGWSTDTWRWIAIGAVLLAAWLFWTHTTKRRKAARIIKRVLDA